MPRSNVGIVGGETGGLGRGVCEGDDGVGPGADWQAATNAMIANGGIRMQGGNVGRNNAKPLGRRGVQFIDHPPAEDLYSRFMDVSPPEAHA
jgi:hypothetical protein